MGKRYKYKAIQIYSSDEWMANSTKRYRTVFDRTEVSYLRVELSFYNKLFDEADWECNVMLKAFKWQDGKKKELCALESEIRVSREENVVYVRDGWGNPSAGTYWYAGEYFWEAFIDKELIGSQQFFINDVGLVKWNANPYFEIEYIKLYTGNFKDGDNRQKNIS